MADNIHYNFGANHGSLTDIKGMLDNINEVKSDIGDIFKTLATVYEGDGAAALQAAHQKIDNMLEEAINTTVNSQSQAQDQQDAMHSLDKANAGDF